VELAEARGWDPELIDLRTKQGWEDLKRILDDRVGDVLAMCGLDMPRRNGWTLIDDPRGDGRECFGSACAPTAWRGRNSTARKGPGAGADRLLPGLVSPRQARRQSRRRLAMQRLGLGNVSAEQLARDRARRPPRCAPGQGARRRHHAGATRKRRAAFAIFANAKPILGTPPSVYLRASRGIDLRAAPFIGPRGGNIAPGSLRFAPAHRYIRRDKHRQRDRRDSLRPA
jgi:hypothetical protein